MSACNRQSRSTSAHATSVRKDVRKHTFPATAAGRLLWEDDGNVSPDLGARYLEFENFRQDTAYDFLLRPPTTASSGRFLCHEVPLSANIARLMPPWRPFFAPFSASD